ncbi:MAG: hypothetical protein ACREKS_07900, partial [Candidatus Rokuibacteriota bacterium]
MPVRTHQIGPCFAAEVEGVDLTKPLSVEAKYSLLHARSIPSRGGNTEFALWGPPTMPSTPRPR